MSSAVDLSVDHRSALQSIIQTVIAPAAAEVDRTGAYPRAALDALGAAGLLGLSSAPEVGGLGGSLADVAETVEQIAAACGSTAMVVLMHYAAVAVVEAHGPRDGAFARSPRGANVSTPGVLRVRLAQPLLGADEHRDGRRRRRAPGRDARAGSPRRARPTATSGRAGRSAADGPMTLWLVPADAAGLRDRGAVRRPRTARQRVEPGGGGRRRGACRRAARRRRRRAGHRAGARRCRCSSSATRRSRSG